MDVVRDFAGSALAVSVVTEVPLCFYDEVVESEASGRLFVSRANGGGLLS